MKTYTDQPVPLDAFLAAGKPGRKRTRVLTAEHYARYCRAVAAACEARDAGRGFLRQEVAGPIPGDHYTWPWEASRWVVYVAPISTVIIHRIERIKVRPGEAIPPAYPDGENYHQQVKIARACRFAIDSARRERDHASR